MSDKRPSEVFLALWRFRTTRDDEETPEDFALCAEAWAEIRRMEGATPHPSAMPTPSPPGEGMGGESTPTEGEKVHPDGVEKVHGDADESIPDRGGATAAGHPGEGDGVVQNGPPARDNEAIGKKAYASRLTELRRGVADIRSRGVSMQSIADAGKNLTLNDVLDFLEGKAIPLPKIAALEKAVKHWEGMT